MVSFASPRGKRFAAEARSYERRRWTRVTGLYPPPLRPAQVAYDNRGSHAPARANSAEKPAARPADAASAHGKQMRNHPAADDKYLRRR